MFFEKCKSSEDLKEEYRRLAMLHHPDRGGKTETMQAINNEYEIAFKRLKDIHRSVKNENETYTAAEETTETAAEFMDIINQIINLDGIKIELIGRWIWIFGNTYMHRETLKKIGFRWANEKKAWTWHKEEDSKRSHKKIDIDTIRGMFGSTEFETRKAVFLN